MKRVSLVIAAVMALFSALPAAAATITASPQSFDVHQAQNAETSSQLTVASQGKTAALVTVQAKDWSSLITASPAEFRLEPGQQKNVQVRFATLPAGVANTEIIVQARDVGASMQSPAAQLRLPTHLDISEQAQAHNVSAIIVGLIILVAVLLFIANLYAAGIKYHIALLWKRLRTHIAAWAIKQPTLKPYIIAVSVLAGLAVIGLLTWGLRSSPQATPPVTANEEGMYQYQVSITTPTAHQIYDLTSEEPLTAFTALRKISETYTIPMEFKTSAMGVFVTSIGSTVNGTDGRYWVYEVNDQKIPVAADAYTLQNQDRLVWKFTTPEL